MPTTRREDAGFRHFWWRSLPGVWPGFRAVIVVSVIALTSLVLFGLGGWLLLRRGTTARADQ